MNEVVSADLDRFLGWIFYLFERGTAILINVISKKGVIIHQSIAIAFKVIQKLEVLEHFILQNKGLFSYMVLGLIK